MFAFEVCGPSGPPVEPSSACARTASPSLNSPGPVKPIGAAARWSRNVLTYQNSWPVLNSRFRVRSSGGPPTGSPQEQLLQNGGPIMGE